MEEKLIQLVEKAGTSVELAIQNIMAEMPQFIHEFILWRIIMHSGWAIGALVFMFLSSYFLYKKRNSYEFDMFIWLFGIFFTVPSFAILVANIVMILKAALAPRIYILDYIIDKV